MELFTITKYLLVGTSFGTLFFSLIFLLFPDLYIRIEEAVNMDLMKSTTFFTVLEGKIDVINDWIFKNRIFFGVLFVTLSIYNIRSLIVL